MADTKPVVQPNQAICIAAVLALLAGLVWLYLVVEKKGKLERQVAAAARRIPGELPSPLISSLPGLKDTASERLEASRLQWVAKSRWEGGTDGIALSTRVQSLLHEFRGRLEQAGIASQSPNLGFEDFTREVALLSSQSDFQSVSVTVDLLRDSMEVLIASRPIALRRVLRQSHAADAPLLFPNGKPGSFEGLGAVSLTLEFEGYTRSLRDFVNAIGDCRPGIIITRMKAGRSPRSETDHTSKLFVGPGVRAEGRNPRPSTEANPFAAFFHQGEQDHAAHQTQPLIGEVVSTFTLTLVRLHEQ
jgi:hypothetical protein